MRSYIVELAEKLEIEQLNMTNLALAELVCRHVLANLAQADYELIRPLHWHAGMTHMGIGVGQVETEVAEIVSSGMATNADLIRVCDGMDELLRASVKLYSEIERFLPHKTYGTKYKDLVPSWKGGIGGACIKLSYTHNAFQWGLKKTTSRIRAAIKRSEALVDISEKATLETKQLCMSV